METKTFEIWRRVTGPPFGYDKPYSMKRFVGIGKVINQHNLWHWHSPALKLGILEIHLNWKPCYYIEIMGERTMPPRSAW